MNEKCNFCKNPCKQEKDDRCQKFDFDTNIIKIDDNVKDVKKADRIKTLK